MYIKDIGIKIAIDREKSGKLKLVMENQKKLGENIKSLEFWNLLTILLNCFYIYSKVVIIF